DVALRSSPPRRWRSRDLLTIVSAREIPPDSPTSPSTAASITHLLHADEKARPPLSPRPPTTRLRNKDLSKHPVDGFSTGLVDDSNVFEWQVTIIGPPDTLYDGGYFNAIMSFPQNYPNNPPSVRFTSEMWHPNVYPDGWVCISILHPPGEDPNGYELATNNDRVRKPEGRGAWLTRNGRQDTAGGSLQPHVWWPVWEGAHCSSSDGFRSFSGQGKLSLKDLAGDKNATAAGDGSVATVKDFRDVALKRGGGVTRLIGGHRTFTMALPRG
ncbi:hypothetical protein ACJX0J_016072, partial [Zea mays]